ncbi:MAG: hypothetical protein EXX96DRAFT_588020 [Benjaminiella poitrasii]|nr:MAG: hypothetical protein EXX96DRAFT_588020 [Benjaminiella poitrasii]
MTDKDTNSQSYFKSSFFSSINALSNQTKNLIPEVNKRLTELQKRARELPTQIASLQNNLASEHEQFVKDKKLDEKNGTVHQRKGSELVAPWMGYRKYEDMMKQAILDISKDERNFLISPPEETNFEFNLNAYSQSAQAVLKEDNNLEKLRFVLVPQQVSERIFWRNYFYRVALVKQTILSNIDPTDEEEEEEEKENKVAPKDEMVLFDFKEDDEDVKPSLPSNDKFSEKQKSKKDEEDYEEMEEWEIELRKAAILQQ